MKIKEITQKINLKNIIQLINGILFYLWHRIIFKKIIYIIPSHRIGHLAAEMNLHFIKNPHSKKNIYIYLTPICNIKLFEMCTKDLNIISDEKIKFFIAFLRRFNLLNKVFHKLTECDDRDVLQLRSTSENTIRLNKEDRKLAKKTLEKNGYSKLLQRKLILLNVRDEAHLKGAIQDIDFGYHKYRNSDIKTYNKMVDYFLSEDFSVIRVGRDTLNRQIIQNDLFLDYSNSPIRSDLLDIYLAEICFACISTGSGYDALTTINNKPILYINYLPHAYCMCFAQTDYTCFKKLKDINSNKIIDNLNELYSRNVFSALSQQQFIDSGFEVVDLSEEEILKCAKNFIKQIQLGENATKREDSQYETSFKNLIKTKNDLIGLHSQDPIVQFIDPNV